MLAVLPGGFKVGGVGEELGALRQRDLAVLAQGVGADDELALHEGKWLLHWLNHPLLVLLKLLFQSL